MLVGEVGWEVMGALAPCDHPPPPPGMEMSAGGAGVGTRRARRSREPGSTPQGGGSSAGSATEERGSAAGEVAPGGVERSEPRLAEAVEAASIGSREGRRSAARP
ncbi:hypothetical protein GCM10009756_18590 [Pseudokineococcus marinus]